MIGLIVYSVCLIAWLLKETDWLRVNLMPQQAIANHNRSNTHELAKRIGWTSKPYKGAAWFEELAKEWLTPLCGWDWLFEHEHDLDNWQPTFELVTDHSKQTIQLFQADTKPIAEVMKIYRQKPKRPRWKIVASRLTVK